MTTDDRAFIMPYAARSSKWLYMLGEFPAHSNPIVTKSDLTRGYITRYFVRPISEPDFTTEVDQDQYSKFIRNDRFICASVNWKIVGKKETTVDKDGIIKYGTIDFNKNLIKKADLTFGGLTRYIDNYEEFWVQEEF